MCVNNGPYVVECNNTPGTTTTDVILSAVGSFDPDGGPLTYLWFEECPFGFIADPTAEVTAYTIDMTGVCSRTCGPFELRVTDDEGNLVKCQTTVTVQDTTAPTIFCPVSVSVVWGDDTTPAATGTAAAIDVCDANPVINFVDSFIPQVPGSGIERTIVRDWIAQDACGNFSTCQQQIFETSPSASGLANLDLDLNGCPNLLDATEAGTLEITVLTEKKLNAATIDWSTVTLQRRDQPWVSISLAAQTFQVGDFGRVKANKWGDCNSTKTDGKADLRITVDRTLLVGGLGLGVEQPGAKVTLALVAKTTAGKQYYLRDNLVIQ